MLTSDCICFLIDAFCREFSRGKQKDKSALRTLLFNIILIWRLKLYLMLSCNNCVVLFSQSTFSNDQEYCLEECSYLCVLT